MKNERYDETREHFSIYYFPLDDFSMEIAFIFRLDSVTQRRFASCLLKKWHLPEHFGFLSSASGLSDDDDDERQEVYGTTNTATS